MCDIFESKNFANLQKYVKSTRTTKGLPLNLYWEDKTACNDRDIANLFNRYFQSLFKKSNEKPCLLNQTKISVIESIYFTETEIKRTMVNLKLNKAMGLNNLRNHIQNKLANGLKKSLHLLFNTIANKSTYPTMWKHSEICPSNIQER